MSFTARRAGRRADQALPRPAALVKNLALLYDQARGPFTYRWTGRGVPDGVYKVQLLVAGAGGALDFQLPIVIDTHGADDQAGQRPQDQPPPRRDGHRPHVGGRDGAGEARFEGADHAQASRRASSGCACRGS